MRLFLLLGCAVLLGPASTSTAGASDAPAGARTAVSVNVDCVGVHVALAFFDGVPRAVLSHANPHSRPPVVLSAPDEMAGYVPVAIACTPSRAGTPYVTVQYSEQQGGCSVCEWLYLYDATGRLLNHNAVLFLHDAGLPAAQQRFPDNSAYAAVATRMHLAPPRFEYLPEVAPVR